MPQKRIDVHAHFLPHRYRQALIDAGEVHPDGMAAIPDWNESSALEMMDLLDIDFAMLSISSPGVHFGNDSAARTLAREVNDEASRLRAVYPDRFGWFAVTPLPDVEGSVTEACYALDKLRADGVSVESNHHGMYLGDSRLEPFYQALNERAAVLFIHPTSSSCSGCGALALGYPRPILEFMFETTRSVTNMVLSGVTKRFPSIRIVVPHAGAALFVLAARIDLFSPLLDTQSAEKTPTMRAELRKFFFDLAGAPVPELLKSLLDFADENHILYGSDWPFTPTPQCRDLAHQLDETNLLSPLQLTKFLKTNALDLFPRLAQAC